MGHSVGIFRPQRGERRHPRWMRPDRPSRDDGRRGDARRRLGGARRGRTLSPRSRAAATTPLVAPADDAGVRASAAARATRGRRSSSPSPGRVTAVPDESSAADPGLTGTDAKPTRAASVRRARQEHRPAAARTPSTRRSRWATASRSRRWRRPRRSRRSSRPATASRARPTCGAAATASGRTRATTARARSPSRWPRRACLSAPLASGPLMSWGEPGKGKWVTIYTQPAATSSSRWRASASTPPPARHRFALDQRDALHGGLRGAAPAGPLERLSAPWGVHPMPEV